jgi:cytochrome c peroxidase
LAPAEIVDQEPILPLPLEPTVALDARKVALGRKLFHDPRLSADDSLSCASCHPLDRGGMDGLHRAKGLGGVDGEVNTPTVFNSALNFAQFWDGRAETLEDQIDSPVQSPREMGASWDVILRKLGQDPAYLANFAEIYPDGLRHPNIKDSIAEFERSLLTPNSRFDRHLRGDASALSAEEKSGYLKFKSYGCVSCHQGVNIGANLFQRMGVIGDYFADRGNVTKADLGRFNVTGQEADRHVFKVPSLRNVAVTAPYFHDGSAQTLEEAVAVMAKYQLGRPLPPQDLSDIVKFLGTLTGEFEGRSP